jgi:hypothetical protein
MGITIQWDNEQQTIMRFDLDPHWTWDELFAAKKQAHELVSMVSHKTVTIIDAPHTTALPPNLLLNARSALRNNHPNTLVVVFVATNPFILSAFSTMSGFLRSIALRLEFAPTLDAARAIAQQHLDRISAEG